jgi:16S rRNA processing protein RimM
VLARFIAVGRVVKAHGVRGELSVIPLSAPLQEVPESVRVWFVPPPLEHRTGRLLSVRQGPKGPLVRVSGIDDRETAATLSGTTMLVAEGNLPPVFLEEPFDPVGLHVIDEAGEMLGQVVDTIATGANDVWVVERTDGGELLLPVIDDVVLDLDLEADRVVVRLLPGL